MLYPPKPHLWYYTGYVGIVHNEQDVTKLPLYDLRRLQQAGSKSSLTKWKFKQNQSNKQKKWTFKST